MTLRHTSIVAVFLSLLTLHLFPVHAQDEQRPLQNEVRRKPNILFILTDDQDKQMDSLKHMPYVQRHLTDRGLTFNHHYCTVALCCPSRVSMWTGKAAHNTNVTDLAPPWGGYPKFISQGYNDKYLPVWLQQAGYGTYYVGKLFNSHSVSTYNSPFVKGWTGSEFLLDPYTYRYLNATFQRNHDKPKSYLGQYATDLVAEKALGFLEDALLRVREDDEPFFLTVAPTAPHSDVNVKRQRPDGQFDENTNMMSPPIPAERHKHLFPDAIVPRTSNFNPDKQGGASWISTLPKQNQTNVDYNDDWYRNRLRALQAVDETVDSLVKRLEEAGVMENTYIVYSTDNGFTIGQHRRQPGKQCAFEQDINIPFIVRGPGIPEGEVTDMVTSHTDVAPTFMALAGARVPSDIEFDGQTIPLSSFNAGLHIADSVWRQEHVNVEMWGIIMSEGVHGYILYPNHTYKALRIEAEKYGYLYVVWCSGEHELYDMKVDPYQVDNLLSTVAVVDGGNFSVPLTPPISTSNQSTPPGQAPKAASKNSNPTLQNLVSRLDALLMVLKTCVGYQCTHPWESLFPDGHVQSLEQALEGEYDDFFQTGVKRVHYDSCEKGYIASAEGPVWSSDQVFGRGRIRVMEHEIDIDEA